MAYPIPSGRLDIGHKEYGLTCQSVRGTRHSDFFGTKTIEKVARHLKTEPTARHARRDLEQVWP